MKKLANKTIFITGASSGIGKAAALLFAKSGANLILCARRVDRLKNLADNIQEKFHVSVTYFGLDVSHKQDVEHALNQLDKTVGLDKIDILINNAGLGRGLDKIYEGHIQDWEEMIDTNLKGLLYITRLITPAMVKKNVGHIINLGSIAGHEVYPRGNVYCATKHAVHAIHQALRLDLFGTNIRVSLISPGIVETEFSEVRFRGDKALAKLPYQGFKPLSAKDIAACMLYCVTCPAHVNIAEIFLTPTAQANMALVNRLSKN